MKRRDFFRLCLASLFSYGAALKSFAQPAPIPQANQWLPEIGGDRFSLIAWGDMGTGFKSQYELIERMLSDYPAKEYPVQLLLGDLSYPTAHVHLLNDNLRKPFARLFADGYRFYPVWGNHDWIPDRSANVKAMFAQPADYYTFKLGPAQFWATNSNDFDATQRKWLFDSLSESRSPWKIVALHHSPFSSGLVHQCQKHLIQSMSPVMARFGVDLCLSAHNHLYERTKPIDGVIYVSSGGGSASLHNYLAEVDFPRVLVKSKHHFLALRGDSEHLVLQAIDSAGTILDTLSLSKPRISLRDDSAQPYLITHLDRMQSV